ncbi:MAG TPA: long-chain fatty acid--CoA ligase [Candidatus Polarisedimenticolaceae bacterium]|nr:long-chain fatty acid--CoA ligase [Candidatus Polarisedimenticolaceae bacterium]
MNDATTLPALFDDTVARHGDRIAFLFPQGGSWRRLSWREQGRAVALVSRALIAQGIEPGDRVALISATRLEWVQCDVGITGCGAATVGIYTSTLAEDCAYILEHCAARLVFVDDAAQLEKLLSIRARLPRLERIVVFDARPDAARGVLGWESFLESASGVPPERLAERRAAIRTDDLAALVYTSGTTGQPKGVMLSHRNLLASSRSAAASLPLQAGTTTLLFLPLAHVFARLIVLFCMRCGVTLAFSEQLAKVPQELLEVRPDFIAAVPRFYEKIREKALLAAEEARGLRRRLFHAALRLGLARTRLRQQGRTVPPWIELRWRLAERLVYRKVQAALGGRVRWAVSGGAPLDLQVAEFFDACGLTILEGIGMTENASFSHINPVERNKLGTVGLPGPGIEVRLAPDGEILFRGECVMLGYYNDAAATAETIDAEGWLHSGDVGEIDAEGYLKITDRKKDLIVTAGGKNIAPQRIERVLRECPYIGQVVVCGDRRKYVSALIALDLENVRRWGRPHGLGEAPAERLAADPRVAELIAGEVERLNARLASYETVKRFRLVPRDFTVDSGELTPSMKVRRKAVLRNYQGLIEQMY